MSRIGMAIDMNASATDPAAVDQARMIESIAEYRIAFFYQAADRAHAGGESRGKNKRRFGALPTCQGSFESPQRGRPACNQRRCTGSAAILPGSEGCRTSKPLVRGESEIIVGGKGAQSTAADLYSCRRRGFTSSPPPVESPALDVFQPIIHPGGHIGRAREDGDEN
jgi:hypothetical protein